MKFLRVSRPRTQTILDEPEVVLTLAHWGFTPQLGESADLSGQHPPTPPPPPPPKQVEGDSEMLEISENGNAQAEEGEFEVADSVPIPIGNRHAEVSFSGYSTTADWL